MEKKAWVLILICFVIVGWDEHISIKILIIVVWNVEFTVLFTSNGLDTLWIQRRLRLAYLIDGYLVRKSRFFAGILLFNYRFNWALLFSKWRLTLLLSFIIDILQHINCLWALKLASELEWWFLIKLVYKLLVRLLIETVVVNQFSFTWLFCLPLFHLEFVRFYLLTPLVFAKPCVRKLQLLVMCHRLRACLCTVELGRAAWRCFEKLWISWCNNILHLGFVIFIPCLNLLWDVFVRLHVL